jgi:hypothetical protein
VRPVRHSRKEAHICAQKVSKFPDQSLFGEQPCVCRLQNWTSANSTRRMSRAGDPDTGGQRSSRQGSARSISTADRVAAVTRETCFRFGRRPWAFGWVSRLLQVLFVVQLAGLSVRTTRNDPFRQGQLASKSRRAPNTA